MSKNIFEFTFVLLMVYILLGVALLGHMINSTFNYLRNCHNVSPRHCSILYSHQYDGRFPISPHLHPHLFTFVLLIKATLVDVKSQPIRALSDISLLTNDEKFFEGSMAMCASPLEKCLFKSSPHFYLGCFLFMLSFKKCSSCVLVRCVICKIVSHSVSCLCSFWIISIDVQKLLNSMMSRKSNLLFWGVPCALTEYIRNGCLILGHDDLHPCFLLWVL